MTFEGIAQRICQDFDQSQRSLAAAVELSAASQPQLLSWVLTARGGLEVDQKKLEAAESTFASALILARQQQDHYQEANILVRMARLATSRRRFDDAVDLSDRARQISISLDLPSLVATNLGNSAWSYFELGDFDNAQENYQEAADASQRAGLKGYQLYWLTGVANSFSAKRDYTSAENLLLSTLALARNLKNAQTVVECLNDLTEIMLKTGRAQLAEPFITEALKWEREGEQLGVIQSQLLLGKLAASRRDYQRAESFFQAVMENPKAEVPLRWQAKASLAGARDDEGKVPEAEQLYKQAIGTIETARSSIGHEELRLSFLTSGIGVYSDYIDFLVRHGRPEDALRQADLSRARTLAEGLSNRRVPASRSALELKPQQLALRFHATLLVYWLGEKHSYLWAISPSKTECFPLPPASEIDSLIKNYRDLTLKSADLMAIAVEAGQKLYATLVAPAKIPSGSRVILLPDGSLYGLNFETLIVPEPNLHFWIEDVTLTTANSLSMLHATANRAPAAQGNLLLVGDAVPVPEFGELPQAKREIEKVGQRFPAKRQTVLQGPQATPTAYLASRPDRYSYVHFVTHGTASRARPLESAVVLSKEPPSDTYKLYARDIVTHPLKAQLVTISACNGSGTRAYSGEGLVGLSWAFLRAGAHNVVGALWEVSDVSTPNLMDKMYAELAAGKDPATALRNAKLSLLHQHNVFSKPFYWAPFQLYSGS